jgi:ribosomal protein S18 acetylase RimI-like enzyme
VDDLYLVPAQRGRGLGRAALERVEAAARELGVRALHLEVERENESARELYRRRGFRDNDRLLMTKML